MNVATKLDYEQNYTGDPAAVMAMLKDPEFVRLKCDKTGSRETTAEVSESADGGCVITSTRVLPSKVPAAAAAFVGETLNVKEVQTWTAPAADGSAAADVCVDFGAPITFTSHMTLAASPTGTVIVIKGEFKAGVPFIGGMIENGALEQTSRYLAVEETLGNEWLAKRQA